MINNPPSMSSKQVQIAATINRQGFMLVVDAKRPWKTVAELTATIKAKGDKATYATAANSGAIMCAIYKDSPASSRSKSTTRSAGDSLNDMAQRQVDFGCHDPVFALSQVREGRLRIFAVATAPTGRPARNILP